MTTETNYYAPLEYVVPEAEDGWLLRTVLQQRLRVSRKLLSRLKQTGEGITVNGERKYITVRVHAGDRVAIRMAEEESEDILPEPLPLDILHEDDHLLIVNKDPGRIVHPTHGHYTGTIANGVVHYWRERGERHRFRPVHRLDQETSGVLAIAKNPYAHQSISEQMQAGTVLKRYRAVVYGRLDADGGTVDAPIGRDAVQRHLRVVRPDGYPSVTHYAAIERYPGATLVELRLETGRTHQIRVHMKHLGHPLVGDRMYVPEPGSVADEVLALTAEMDRQALHADRLGFRHPGTGGWVEFQAPLPGDMCRLLERLHAAHPE